MRSSSPACSSERGGVEASPCPRRCRRSGGAARHAPTGAEGAAADAAVVGGCSGGRLAAIGERDRDDVARASTSLCAASSSAPCACPRRGETSSRSGTRSSAMLRTSRSRVRRGREACRGRPGSRRRPGAARGSRRDPRLPLRGGARVHRAAGEERPDVPTTLQRFLLLAQKKRPARHRCGRGVPRAFALSRARRGAGEGDGPREARSCSEPSAVMRERSMHATTRFAYSVTAILPLPPPS